MNFKSRYLFLLAILLPILGFSQSYKGIKAAQQSVAPAAALFEYNVIELPIVDIAQAARTNSENLVLDLDILGHDWKIQLHPSGIVPDDYVLNVLTDNGIITSGKMYEKAFVGVELNSGGTVRLTIDNNFFYGYIEENGNEYFIEPLSYHERSGAKNQFVLYKSTDVIPTPGISCGVTETQEKTKKYSSQQSSQSESLACYEADIAIASDKSMFTKYGSITAVENHNIGVLNNVEGDYTGSFVHDIEYVIPTQFVVTGTDPWTTSTAAGTVLDDFRSWGNAGNFGVAFDLGEFWTDRNFNGGTVGVAWVGAVCSSFKYHVLEDFSSTAWALRVLTSHEMGHNWDLSHDGSGSGFIMAPSVNNSTSWSAASQSDFNTYMPTRISANCLQACSGGGSAPVANFSANPTLTCTGQPISLSDQSTNTPTSWSWSFPGGTPTSSNAQNPTVSYNTPGTKTITLTASNGSGSDTHTSNVTIQTGPNAFASASISNLSAVFNNQSSNATSYMWFFGDGTTSTAANPNHTYTIGGTYTVTLDATSSCGTDSYTFQINTAPTASFSATPSQGCDPFVATFTNNSSPNATSFFWTLPGATPGTSTDFEPTVTYNSPGSYGVTLQVFNAVGNTTTTVQGYIQVVETPFADYTYTANGLTVDFDDTSLGATSYLWLFGDGNTSTQVNPTHTYAAEGTYSVTIEATSACGTDIFTQQIQVIAPPTSGFTSAVSQGCAPLTVQYTNQSTGTNVSYNWSFPGGTPSSSTDQNPVITYDLVGDYDATLIATNSAGTNSTTENNFIVVQDEPFSGFTFTNTGTMYSFINTTIDGATFLWDFGDGNTSTEFDPNHTYTTAGTYTVSLTATNNCGSNQVVDQISVITPPTATFTASPNAGCTPLTVQYTSTTTGAATYNWSFPGGTPSTSTMANPTVVYNVNGIFSANLQVGNTAGSTTASQTDIITVGQGPNVAFSSASSNATVAFTNNSSAADSYSWDFGDGNTSTAASPSHTYTADETYTVVLTASNACGSNTSTETVTVVTPVTANFSATMTNGCTPMTVQFTNNSSNNSTDFVWNFPGGTPTTSTDASPVVTYSTAGTYDVTLTANNSGYSATADETNFIIVGQGAAAAFSSAIANAQVTFTNGTVAADSYSWDFGDGNTSTTESPSHTYSADGTYTVVLTATNTCGASTSTETVTIVTPVTASFGASTTNGCTPMVVQFSNNSSSNSTDFVWNFPGGTPATSTDANPMVTYSTAGTYGVTLTSNNSGFSATTDETNYITVGQGAAAAFSSATANAQVTFTNGSAAADSYSWDFGDGNTSTTASPSHTYSMDGTYTVVLTATNTCGASTSTETVTIVTPVTAGFGASITNGCTPMTVQFSNSSSSNASGYVWNFPGGTPATSTETNPVVTYSTPGTYSVSLTSNNSGFSATADETNYITVGQGASASFSTATANALATFTNASTAADSYSWDFGDGNTSTNENPTHTYSTDGQYVVVLTATNTCGSTTFTETVTVVTPPSASFTATSTSGCAPFNVQFSNTSSSNATGYLWTFSGGTPGTSTDQNPIAVFDAAGSYSVTLEVSNAAGTNTSTQMNFINVVDGPTAGFSSTTSNSTTTFTNSSANADSYLWDFGDGNTSTSANPTYVFTSDGTYTVVLTATSACGTSTSTETITIVTPPSANFTATNTMGCGPLTVQFTNASSANAGTFAWTFAGGTPATSTDPNPSVIFDTPGTYSVGLTVGNAAGNSTLNESNFITVLDVPTADFMSTQMGASMQFSNASVDASSYSWDFGDGNTSSDVDPTHGYSAPGTYTVVLTAINDCGTDMFTQTVTVMGMAPTALFDTDLTLGCAPETIQFSDLSTGMPTAWNWTFAGGTPATSTDQNPSVIFDTPGLYDVSLEVTNAFGTSNVTTQNLIQIEDIADASFTYVVQGSTGLVDFTSNATNASTYMWDFGDGNTSTDPNPSHTYAVSGTYSVSLIVANGCGTNTVTTEVNATFTSANDLDNALGMRLYPNPTSGLAILQLDGGFQADALQVRLTNTLGQVVQNQYFEYFGQPLAQQLDYTDVAAGVYFVHVRLGNEMAQIRIVVD